MGCGSAIIGVIVAHTKVQNYTNIRNRFRIFVSIRNFVSCMDYLTKEGLQKLREELEVLETDKRKEIARRLKEAASFGDLSENAEYQEVKEEQAFVDGRVDELREILRNARIIDGRNGHADSVQIGSAVEVLGDDKKKRKFLLVGNEQADPFNCKVSPESPLGKALLGRKKGEAIDLLTTNGKKTYHIVKIA